MNNYIEISGSAGKCKRNGLIIVCIVAVAFFITPLLVAGTFDPCEATARVVAQKKLPNVYNSTPLEVVAFELAVKVGAGVARNHGIAACYRMLPKALALKPEAGGA